MHGRNFDLVTRDINFSELANSINIAEQEHNVRQDRQMQATRIRAKVDEKAADERREQGGSKGAVEKLPAASAAGHCSKSQRSQGQEIDAHTYEDSQDCR